MAEAPRDQNHVTAMLFESSTTSGLTVAATGDQTTGRLFVDLPGGAGTVTSVSVVSANGFAGTVATATSTPAITISTSVTGILKGNGTAMSAASAGTDYVAPGAITTSGLTMATGKMLGRATALTGAIEEIATTGTGSAVLATSPTLVTPALGAFTSTSGLVGADANFADFPNAKAVVSLDDTTEAHAYNIGLVGEATATSADAGRWGVGLYGAGRANGATKAYGVVGEGKVSNTNDGLVAGVRGYSTDTHAGSYNIGLYGEATGSSVANYGLYLASGDLLTAAAADWDLLDNNASALSFDSTGKTGILEIVTTDSSEGVKMSGTLNVTGHITVEGVTSTGATGTNLLVFATSPTLTTPTLGVATATSINKMAITAPATSSTLAVADGKTLTASNTLTLAGTDSTTMTFPSTSASIARTDAAQTFTGTQTFSQIVTTNNAITASGNAATVPITSRISTVTNNSAATLTITITTTSAVDGMMVIVRILDFSAAAQTITWVNTENSTVTAPTTSNGSTTLPLTVGFQYNSATSKWRCIASA